MVKIKETIVDNTTINYFLSDDIVFKIFFTRNKYMLKKLISMSLQIKEEKIKQIKILNPELISNTKGDKIGVLDLLVELENKEKINIEIQNAKGEDDFSKRIKFYLSNLYVKNLKRRENYKSLNKVYGIYLLNYNDKNYPNFFSRIVEYDIMNKKTTKELEEKVIYNLTKIEEIEKYKFSEEEQRIIRLIKCKNEKELEDMSLEDEKVRRAIEQLKEINADEELQMYLYYKLKNKLDAKSIARAEVREELEKELKEELDSMREENERQLSKLKKESDEKTKAKDTLFIKTLYDMGKTIHEISNITKLNINYIKEILGS